MPNDASAVPTFSFSPPEWLKPFNGSAKIAYGAISKEVWGFTASRLQEQADYLKKLAECDDAAEAIKCHFEFAQQSWSRSVGDVVKAFEHLRTPSAE
ncbi:phasin family protein [Bradyrhizobium sp. PMVTL-01]|uniref:phasin family protein n=1 Tax=unclassified Bradyrhizobium TaxID=2631580 RepID=UPI003F70307A